LLLAALSSLLFLSRGKQIKAAVETEYLGSSKHWIMKELLIIKL
jgi:hypothetical protein